MSGLDLAAIREALADRLATIPGLYVYRQWPGTPSILPCAVIFPPDSVDYSKTSQRGLDLATWDVLTLVGPLAPTSQAFLEGLMSDVGDLSVITCLYEDRRLGGLVSNLRVPEITTGMYAVSRNANDDVAGCEFRVEIAG